ncbi:recombinase RecT [Limosilactobacillus reuteri]|uniref:recombinase RecT n=1 Tax=Limosilactobacillus reuteri TaxID=1598 RepID=UPI001E32E87B|nr:recombinase RecT [Limosilactobacillus reuteri]MCC4349327.1 recombinase RecT [Limosilactobacillus reuteri]MCC4359718.1 recombinase RecT [Limosilactobacillus reuteri]MCC4379665.1 recombinase RecT [Limosilactobacillus reuteri]MCC4407354.1 recombinase RecT [Limosilactobacillus reuteri]MCC4416675.1 recombinase RecT [Limosilactobacillus reuteri]
MNNQVANTQQITVKQFVNMNSTKKRFEDVLGKRAPQFMSSLVSVVNSNQSLQHVNAGSVINSALVAATLDLPINPSLGYMYIVPYKGQAQPQMGYKGYIQLAQRSGQYKRLNAIAVYADEFQGWNPLTEEIDYQPNFRDRSGEQPIGYIGYLELLNGFQKTVYWTREQIDEHRKRFSKMSGGDNPKGVWKDNFDAMALKTVLRNLLTKWGPMTVDMQTAYNADEEEHVEPIHDVTPEPNSEEGYQTQDILNSFDQAEKEKASKEEAKPAKKATKTAKKTVKKGDEVNGTSESQEELFPDGTITPHTK